MKKAPSILALLTLSVALSHAQVYTDLFNFDNTDGSVPQGLLAQGRDGNLYGTATLGGVYGRGVVFEVALDGQEKVLFSFGHRHTDGSLPYSGLTLGTDGDFYGTTEEGGAVGWGSIFKITPSGILTTLYSFCSQPNCADGALPTAPPIQGADGSFYGTTTYGTAYKITSAGTFTPLATLPGSSDAPLIQETDGNFYGTTYNGGRSLNCPGGCGTVFRMTPKGIVTTLYEFSVRFGKNPQRGVIQGSDGNLYGTAEFGGSYHQGVVFKLTPQGITVLHSFGDPSVLKDGVQPYAGLVQATDGNFYGNTPYNGTSYFGEIFQVSSTGAYSILHNFDGTDGQFSQSTPMQHTNGGIYGLTEFGGSSSGGVVYSLDLSLAPFVRLVSPAGKVGQTGGVLGQEFTGTSSVSFNGIPAAFSVLSDTYLTATVPAGATTGFVTVVTPSGTLSSNQQFQVRP
jgi:uncharacterized repeat protein (TIGR03803 family)